MYETSLEEKAALLGPYLERHVDGFRGPLQLEKFDQGRSNPAFLMTASYFRAAAICQGVCRRALDGNASAGRAITRGNLTPRLAAMAAELVNEESVL
ncbi:hypothetical protein N9241_00865 [bacterium]|nr:hypothetical protein [bacterium]